MKCRCARRYWLAGALGALATAAALLGVWLARHETERWPPARPLVSFAIGYHPRVLPAARAPAAKGRSVQLALALAARGESLERAGIGGLVEPIVYAPAPTSFTRRATLPKDARLAVDYGVLPDAWRLPPARVGFRVEVTTAAGDPLIRWRDVIDTAYRRECRWHSAEFDLAEHAGEQVVLRFVTETPGVLSARRAALFAVWGDPTLVGAAQESDRPNIILIVVDALRADHVGCYGYARHISPTIDALAQRGTRFDHAFSQAPWTIPSVASILTGRYPSEIRDATRLRLAEQVETLPQALSRRGYTCAAITANPVATSGAGFDRGFRRFDARPNLSFVWRSAETMTAHALDWLRLRAHRPFFLYLHYMDPHDPYSAPDAGAAAPGAAAGAPVSRAVAEGRPRVIEEELGAGRRGPLTLDERRYLALLYDGEVAYVDRYIGVLLSELDREGLRRNTAIILTADHGEGFFEHGRLRHGYALYRELLQVPLIVVAPGDARSGRVIQQLVGLTDIAATALDVAHAGRRFGRGESLLGHVDGARGGGPPVFSQLGAWLIAGQVQQSSMPGVSPFWASWLRPGQSVVVGRGHLIRNDGGAVELYDLAADPEEQRDIARSQPARVKQLTSQLLALAVQARPRQLPGRRPAAKIDEETMRRLRSLGYVR
jgi:arylsulfatase A-like enzyme